MNDDFYEYDPHRYTLVGVTRGRKIRLGDKVRVKVAAASVEARKIDLVFAD
jgi:ribonuclease R